MNSSCEEKNPATEISGRLAMGMDGGGVDGGGERVGRGVGGEPKVAL